MRIKDVETSSGTGGFRLDCLIEGSFGARSLFYEVTEVVKPPSAEMAVAACLAAILPVASWLGEDIEIEDECDREFLFRSDLIARAYRRLHGLEKRIKIKGNGILTQPGSGRNTTCSFSGGVDSMFSVLRNVGTDALYPISSVTTIFGVDVPHHDVNAHVRVREKLKSFSIMKSLDHIFVRTNYREVFDDLAPWGQMTHGACIASVALVLSGNVETYLLPSSSVIDMVYPWGSHPMIDDSFISSHTRVINDSWHFYRNEKTAAIAEDSAVLKHLKVCNKLDRVSNCCKCEKCIRTMAMLKVLGKLEAAESFPDKLTLSQLREHKIKNKKEIYRFEQLMIEAQARKEYELASAVNSVLRRGRLRLLRRNLIKRLGLHK